MVKHREAVLVILLALFLAAVVHHVLVSVSVDDVRRSILAGLFLLDGKPHWRVFQNRVLGPFIARTFMRAAGAPDLGYMAFEFLSFGSAFVLAWWTGLRIVGSLAGALACMLTLALALVALFQPSWFYPWDVVGVPLYMAFAWLVVSDARYRAFVLLFCVAIWNRDDALFIALFLTVRPMLDWWRARRDPSRPPFAWRRSAFGAACMVAGVVLILALRKLLLVEEMGPKMFTQPPNQGSLFRWTLEYNFDYISHHMPLGRLEAYGFVMLPPLVTAAACIFLARVRDGKYLSYALVNLAMVAATLMFGIIHEIRIWADLLPPIVLATAFALANADKPAPMRS